jgi:hypothetical protein
MNLIRCPSESGHLPGFVVYLDQVVGREALAEFLPSAIAISWPSLVGGVGVEPTSSASTSF